jgi:hypothetical protein
MDWSSQNIPAEIRSFCERCAEGLEGLSDQKACIEFSRKELSSLLLKKEMFIDLMKSAIAGGGYPDIRRPTMFDNELVLYADPRGLFSLRMYLWAPGEYTQAHDHNSWGVIGTVSETYEVINYRREDDGSRDGYARLVELDRINLVPGETAYTLPLDKGIHKTGNPSDKTIITLNFYGRSLPRGYLLGYDPLNDRVFRILPPRLKKHFLINQALKSLNGTPVRSQAVEQSR